MVSPSRGSSRRGGFVDLGILLDLRNPARWRRPWAAHYRQQLEWVETVEGWGAGSVWLTEHHFFDDGYLPSSMAICGAIAARTGRVTVSTDVIPLPLHHPLRIPAGAVGDDEVVARIRSPRPGAV